MNCSESQRLRTLLSRLLLDLHHRGNASGLGTGPGPSIGMGAVPDPFLDREVTSAKGDDAYLYILLIMIFYACLAGGLILAYTRFHKLVEAKDELSQACPDHQWAAGGALTAADAETAAGSPAEGPRQLALAQGTEGV
ncbi:potassium voltage-gated channel subfamily E regulatory beta subunit 5 [Saccopteryx bilineata]|uniref:potassium voltage-gated channel subfamily E regulatory beta subunit 5 n=1 Tax=Saccopteryx bilineata TaxID=59482 RepID=UPI0033903C4C